MSEPTPVAPVVAHPSARLFAEILVPTDFSDHATQALRLAIALARTHGARITLVHVGVAALAMYEIEPYSVPMSATLVAMHEEMAKEQKHVLDRIARDEIPDDVPWRTIALEGFPPEEIVRCAEGQKCDLIVMSTHGRSGLSRAFLGSVTERVMRASTVPVLVTR